VSECPRRVVFELSAALLVDLFKAGKRSYEVVRNTNPDDARVYGAAYDPLRDVWRVGLEHESFPACAEGNAPEVRHPDIEIREILEPVGAV
jgi:hypothetical protein